MSTDFRSAQCGLPSGVSLLTLDLLRATALPAYTAASDGNTFTADANGALTVDGVVVTAGKLLGYGNSGDAAGGVFEVVQPGTAGTPWILRRLSVARYGAIVGPALYLRILAGTRYAGTSVRLYNDAGDGTSITIGTSTLDVARMEDRCALSTFSDGSGTPGNVTQTTGSGRAAIAGGATACVVTNPLCGPNSVVSVTLEDLDATATRVKCVPGSGISAGTFTVTANAPATADVKFRYTITNTP